MLMDTEPSHNTTMFDGRLNIRDPHHIKHAFLSVNWSTRDELPVLFEYRDCAGIVSVYPDEIDIKIELEENGQQTTLYFGLCFNQVITDRSVMCVFFFIEIIDQHFHSEIQMFHP